MAKPEFTVSGSNSPRITPLYLSSIDMQMVTQYSIDGAEYLTNNLVVQKLLQQMAMSIVASMEVKDFTPELIPPPVALTVTTLFPVMDDFIFDLGKPGLN